jgi:hypothetical protein
MLKISENKSDGSNKFNNYVNHLVKMAHKNIFELLTFKILNLNLNVNTVNYITK